MNHPHGKGIIEQSIQVTDRYPYRQIDIALGMSDVSSYLVAGQQRLDDILLEFI